MRQKTLDPKYQTNALTFLAPGFFFGLLALGGLFKIVSDVGSVVFG